MLRRLASLKLAAWLMIVSIALLVLAIVIPQRNFLGPVFDEFVADYPGVASLVSVLALDRLFQGWALWLITGVLCLNVLVCTLNRLSPRRRRVSQSGMRWRHVGNVSPEAVVSAISGVVDDAGFARVETGRALLAAQRGVSGFWGSIVLHLSILVIAVGGIASALLSFSGEMVIADGQSLQDTRSSYLSVAEEPRFGSAYSGVTVSVDDVEFAYEAETLVKAIARMRAIDGAGRVITKDVSVNHPLDVGGKSFLLMDSGLAAELVLPGAAGEEIRGSIVNLGQKTSVGWQDSIEVAGPDGETVVLELIAMPVRVESGGEMPAEEFLVTDPHLFLRSFDGDSIYAERLLTPGESVEIAPGLDLTFTGMRVWNRYLVRGDQGRWITYVGFWLAVAGTIWRFAVPHRIVAVRECRDGTGLEIGFRSYPWDGLAVNADEDMLARIASVAGDPVIPHPTKPEPHDSKGGTP
ncbi:MAG: hypothetical protein CVT60_06560 [Actinobacteria bacterium HGW-Actinobacteria-10]|nr:MAG: hypothetical protein CVT60_06560 [Actinobacteria bacterium HGW-Actinobacteria-10]